jgi:hypothetical protein
MTTPIYAMLRDYHPDMVKEIFGPEAKLVVGRPCDILLTGCTYPPNVVLEYIRVLQIVDLYNEKTIPVIRPRYPDTIPLL